MQFLKLFSTVCAVCCTFVPEGTRGMKSEDGKVGDDKKAIVESVGMQPRLNELGGLLNELFSAADDICEIFVNFVIPSMKPEEMKDALKDLGSFYDIVYPKSELEFEKLNHDVISTYIYRKKPITRYDLLQITFTCILETVEYCFSWQWQRLLWIRDNTKTSENWTKPHDDFKKLRSVICHKLEDLFKELNSTIPNNQQTELQIWLEEMITERPKKVYNFLMEYNDVLENNDVDYICGVLSSIEVSLDIPEDTTIEDLVSIIKTNQWTDLNNEDTTTTNPETSTKERV